jgi:hypothetical protein
LKYRIHNSNFDVIVEADRIQDVMKKFAQEHPDKAGQTVYMKKVED